MKRETRISHSAKRQLTFSPHGETTPEVFYCQLPYIGFGRMK